jgi:hypothetical protein
LVTNIALNQATANNLSRRKENSRWCQTTTRWWRGKKGRGDGNAAPKCIDQIFLHCFEMFLYILVSFIDVSVKKKVVS